MRKNGHHIIQKVTLDIFTASTETGRLMEREAANFFYKKILPHLEAYFDELEAQLGNQTLEIPRLSIDIQLKPEEFLNNANFERPMRMAMNEVISALPGLHFPGDRFTYSYKGKGSLSGMPASRVPYPENGIADTPKLSQNNERFFEAWLHYMQSGRLPWWFEPQLARQKFRRESLVTEFQKISKRESFLNALQLPQVRNRLISQYSVTELSTILSEGLKDWVLLDKPAIEGVLEIFPLRERTVPVGVFAALAFYLSNRPQETKTMTRWFSENLSQESKKRVEKAIFNFISKEDKRVWSPFFNKIIPTERDSANDLEKQQLFRKKKSDEKKVALDDQEESYYVECAGLILIHPFLKAFFSDCGFFDEKGNLREKELAVHSLYYLVTREEYPFDFELLFEKYLCGVPLHAPISRKIQLPDFIKEKSEALLGSLIEHWGKLKHTGKDTVRQEFINRSGKLIIDSSADHLYVERKPQDILLDSLPWNIGLVKLPWKNSLLFIEW